MFYRTYIIIAALDSATYAQNDEGCDWDVDSATTAHNDVLVSVNSYATGDVCTVSSYLGGHEARPYGPV